MKTKCSPWLCNGPLGYKTDYWSIWRDLSGSQEQVHTASLPVSWFQGRIALV